MTVDIEAKTKELAVLEVIQALRYQKCKGADAVSGCYSGLPAARNQHGIFVWDTDKEKI